MSSRATGARFAAIVGMLLLVVAGVGGWQATRYAAHAAERARPRPHIAPQLHAHSAPMPAGVPNVVAAITSPDATVRMAAIAPDTLQALGVDAKSTFYPAGTSLRPDPATWRQYGDAIATMNVTVVTVNGSAQQQLVFINSDKGWLLSMTTDVP